MRWRLLVAALVLVGCGEVPTRPPPVHAYAVPPETGDGWQTAHVSDVGIAETPLAEMVDRIRDGSYTNIHSVLLVRRGRLVFEEYFPGTTTGDGNYVEWDRSHLHDLHSVTKSVTSALIGSAIDQGLISSVDEKISTYFPEHAAVFADGPRARLTLRHFLTMTAGLEWDEHSYPYTDGRNSHVQLNRSGDPIGFTLQLPVVAEPGQTFRYNSGLSIVLGEIIHRVTGLTADVFAEQFLFGPLGIQDYSWWTYPNGIVQTGGGLALRPRDMVRFGQLFLNQGTWGEERVISQEWVRQSTTWQAPDTRYGYQWWGIRLHRHDNAFDLSDQVLEAAAAVGRGGQWILVYPELDLVAVFTGGNDNRLSDQPLDILRRYVFPAMLASP
jgi:CubicO group peptidase (beta-lactamase class C family)